MTGNRNTDIVPRIRRARGFRLYDEAGKRYVDLYQAGGTAILGHRGPGTVREMKDVLSRGLGTALPNVYETRLKKVLRRLFPSYGSVELYACIHRGLDAVSAFLGRRMEERDIFDPAVSSAGNLRGPVSYWRPFLPAGALGEPEVLIPILPGSGISGFAAACFRTREGESVPPGDSIPACPLAGVLRAIADLAGTERGEDAVTRAADETREWRRRGPYLSPEFHEGRYRDVFRLFLDAGYLLNPHYPGPSIVPGELSPGEAAGLCRLFTGAQGG